MVRFREASKSDYKNIAALHTISWQQNYRGTFTDYYLDATVIPERLAVWKGRLSHPSENQCVVLAEEDGVLLGFGCAYVDKDDLYGSYLDNLHVSNKANAKGLGTLLMQWLVKEIRARKGVDSMYLWVLENNKVAIDFYEKLKGRSEKPIQSDDIGDRTFWQIRYVWDSLERLEECIDAKLERYEHRRI
jgi:ribosomal protein S18 acetylase RimI-like enzyme